MNSKLLITVLLSLLIGGCKSDDDDDTSVERSWRAEFLVPDATNPLLSPDGSEFLFLRDGEGLFLWHDGVETPVTPEGVTARPDFSWSVSGESLFAFSVPGLPGGEAGIFVSGMGGTLTQIWDRGSSPVYDAAHGYVYAAGPETSETESGIWRLSTVLDTFPLRLTETGTSPQLGDSVSTLAYLGPVPASNGATLTARSLTDLSLLSETPFVSRFQIAKESSYMLVEIVVSSEGLAMPPAVYKMTVTTPQTMTLIAHPATHMALLDDGSILFNRLEGDQFGALVLHTNDDEYVLSDTLFAANANLPVAILAVGLSGITRLTEN